MKEITWRLKLPVDPQKIFHMLTSDEGREMFWAERSRRNENGFHMTFPNGQATEVEVLESVAPHKFSILYFGAQTTFTIDPFPGHSVLTLHAITSDEEYVETCAGWVSVLLCLKAQVVAGIDLRNHERSHSWDFGFVDN